MEQYNTRYDREHRYSKISSISSAIGAVSMGAEALLNGDYSLATIGASVLLAGNSAVWAKKASIHHKKLRDGCQPIDCNSTEKI